MIICQHKRNLHLFEKIVLDKFVEEEVVLCNLGEEKCPYNTIRERVFFTESETGIEYVCSSKGVIEEYAPNKQEYPLLT